MAIAIVPIEERHVPAVVAIHTESFPTVGLDREGKLAKSHAHVEDERARPFSPFFVAEDGHGIVLGYSLCWIVVDEVHLLEVAVLPEARRLGVGRALAEHVIETARRLSSVKILRILLDVRRGNTPARGLYDSLGFTVFSERPGYYPDGEDALEMELPLV